MRLRFAFLGLAATGVAASLALNVIQAQRIVALQREVERQPAAQVFGGGIAAGARAPDIRARDGKGREFALRFDAASKPTVVYAFSPSCHWCEGNANKFNSLVAQASGKYSFVALALNGQGLQEFVERHGIKEGSQV